MVCGLNQEGTNRCRPSKRSVVGQSPTITQGKFPGGSVKFWVNASGNFLPPDCLAIASGPNNLLPRFSEGMPHSHHSHSGEFCKHAVGTLEDVVVEAIRRGFRVFGLSEHVPRYRTSDLYPEEVGEMNYLQTCDNESPEWPHSGRSHETIRRIHR